MVLVRLSVLKDLTPTLMVSFVQLTGVAVSLLQCNDISTSACFVVNKLEDSGPNPVYYIISCGPPQHVYGFSKIKLYSTVSILIFTAG